MRSGGTARGESRNGEVETSGRRGRHASGNHLRLHLLQQTRHSDSVRSLRSARRSKTLAVALGVTFSKLDVTHQVGALGALKHEGRCLSQGQHR